MNFVTPKKLRGHKFKSVNLKHRTGGMPDKGKILMR